MALSGTFYGAIMKNILTAFVHTKKVNWVQTALLSLPKIKTIKNIFKKELLCPITKS